MINIPETPPTGAPKPKKPKHKFRPIPGGNVIAMIAIPFGMTRAAPVPLIALAIENATRLSVQNPLARDQITHQAPPMRRTFLCPYTAPIRPLIRTKALCVSLYGHKTLIQKEIV